jgi:succinyl-diaminopimelate desuccinylase
MKSGLAAAMIAAAALKRSGARLAGRLVVGALVDEEGDMLGAKHLCRTPIGRELTAAIICEPEDNELCLEQRGVVWARVRARGKMAHGAMPEAGINPIACLGAMLREAPGLERRLRRRCERSRYLRPPTVTPTIAQAPPPGVGVAQSNVIPAVAEMTLDVRVTPGIGAEGLREELEALCRAGEARCPGVEVEWEPVNAFRLPTRVDRSEPIVRAMVSGMKAATGRAPRYGGVPGSTDGTILRMELGLPIVTCGPGNRLIPHQVDEYVEVAQLVDAARIYAVSALNYLEASLS